MASYQTISKDDVHEATQQTVTAALETLPDPSNTEKRQMIYQSQPLTANLDSEDYPLIVLEDYSFTEDSTSLGGYMVTGTVNAEIHIETRDDGPNYKQWFDTLSDDVIALFKSKSGAGKDPKFEENQFGKTSIDRNSRSTGITEDGLRIIRREIEVSFQTQLDFS